jgi:hypothetical protein
MTLSTRPGRADGCGWVGTLMIATDALIVCRELPEKLTRSS